MGEEKSNNKGWIILTGITVAIISLSYFSVPKRQPVVQPEEGMKSNVLPTLYYGFPIDSFEITKGKVKWNQNLSEILENFNVSSKSLHLLSQRSKSIYDVRRLNAGAVYSVIHEKDVAKTARQFIFEPNAFEYVVYHFSDSVYAELHRKPVQIVTRKLATEITSSVYNAVIEQKSSPVLVNKLVDVFAWQINFFRIRNGDRFKVIYEEERVDDKAIGIRSIKAAYFEHRGKKYYAIPYKSKGKTDYFDEEGNSLRKTFLKAPLNYSRISSRFSLKRFHPVQNRYKAHLGTDYVAPRGTPIHTVGDGVVLEARYHHGNGNYVKIKHNSNYTTQYLHMSKIARGIRKGVAVKQGTTIGYVGSTGLATGSHLCFRFWKNGRQVDALKVDLPPLKGIAQEDRPRFKARADSIKAVVDNINYHKPNTLYAIIERPLPTVE